MTNSEWLAVAVGAIIGWVVVSWVIDKVRSLNARPSPFDERKDAEPAANVGEEVAPPILDNSMKSLDGQASRRDRY